MLGQLHARFVHWGERRRRGRERMWPSRGCRLPTPWTALDPPAGSFLKTSGSGAWGRESSAWRDVGDMNRGPRARLGRHDRPWRVADLVGQTRAGRSVLERHSRKPHCSGGPARSQACNGEALTPRNVLIGGANMVGIQAPPLSGAPSGWRKSSKSPQITEMLDCTVSGAALN